MNLKTRRVLLFTFIILFFPIGASLVLYSKGWQFNPKTFSFYRAGAINIGGQPENTKIKIKELNRQIDAGSRKKGILISDLVPADYTLEVEKDGYQSWVKNLAVRSALVAQTYKIILLPKQIETELFLSSVKNFWLGKKYTAWQTTGGKLIINNKTVKGTELIDWINDDSALTYDKTTKNYFVVDASKNGVSLNINLIFNNLKEKRSFNDSDPFVKIIPYSVGGNKLLVLTQNKIYFLDFFKFDLEIIPVAPSSVLFLKNNDLFLIKQTGLYSFNIISRNEKLITVDIKNKPELADLSPNDEGLALISDKKLILVNLSDGTTKEIAPEVKYFKFSPDNEKIAYLESDGGLKIFFLKDQTDYSEKKAGDFSDLGAHSSNPIKSFEWHKDSAYLFVKYLNSLSLLEIDDRLPINEQKISDGLQDYRYNPDENLIYFLRENRLYKLDLKSF